MTISPKWQKIFYYVCLYSIVLTVFARKIEWYVLDVSFVDWLMGPTTDNITDLTTWEYYRYALATDQWGVFYNYGWPQTIGVGNTSIIPLLAIPFKYFSSFLPEHFQYFGWFLFLCFLLQAFFADRLLGILQLPIGLYRFCAAILLTIAPVLLVRDPHISLCAHWLILWSLCLYFEPSLSYKRLLIYAIIMACCAALIHPYLVLFPLSWVLVMSWRQLRRDLTSGIKALLLLLLPFIATYLCFYCTGMFSLGEGESSSSGFGYYAANLNTFINGMGYSRLGFLNLPNRFDGQYEGFAYLGMGILLLWLLILILVRQTLPMIFFLLRKHYALILLCLGLSIYATGFIFCFNEHIVYEKRFSDEHRLMLSVFRSSGRFIWLAHYLLILTPLVLAYRLSLHRRCLYVTFPWLLLLLAALQLYDIEPLYAKHTFSNNFHPPKAYPYYADIARNTDIIYAFPAYERKMQQDDDVHYLLHVAAPYRTKITAGHLPRPSLSQQYAITDRLRSVISGYEWSLEENAVLMSGKDQGFLFAGLLARYPEVRAADIGGTYIFYKEANRRIAALADQYRWPVPQFNMIEIGDFLDQYPDHYWILAVKDDAASGITQTMKDYFTDKHSVLAGLKYREAYIGVFSNKKLLFEETGYSRAALDTLIRLVNGKLINCSLQSISAWEGKNDAHITIDGKEQSLNRRGINIVILDKQGNLVRSKSFDTFLSSLSVRD